jgi:hypothetical protein
MMRLLHLALQFPAHLFELFRFEDGIMKWSQVKLEIQHILMERFDGEGCVADASSIRACVLIEN